MKIKLIGKVGEYSKNGCIEEVFLFQCPNCKTVYSEGFHNEEYVAECSCDAPRD